MQTFIDALLFRANYLTTLLTITLGCLGGVAGVVGTFTLMRKVTMVGDVIAHAQLPGIAIAFAGAILTGLAPHIMILLIGALLSASFATYAIYKIFQHPKITEDTAIAATIGGFFSLGVLLSSITQTLKTDYTISFADFLIGSPTRLTQFDSILILLVLFFVMLLLVLYRKPLILASFDREYAGLMGVPYRKMDKILLLALLLTATVSMICIGAILTIALITIPAITARLWSYHINRLLLTASTIGAVSAYLGIALSAATLNLPPSGSIILVQACMWAVSMLLNRKKA